MVTASVFMRNETTPNLMNAETSFLLYLGKRYTALDHQFMVDYVAVA